MLYGEPNFPRNIVQIICDFIINFIINVYCKSIEDDILKVLKNNDCEETRAFKIRECFKKHSRIFTNFSSESNRFTLLEDYGFQDIEDFVIQSKYVEKINGIEPIFFHKVISGVRISLKNTLEKFLKIPGLTIKIIENVKKLSNESDGKVMLFLM